MPIQYLLLHSRVRIPHSTSLVTTGSDDLVSLRVELDLRYLILVALEKCSASSGEYIIHSGQAISGRCRQLITSIIERCIEYLVIVPLESFYALAGCDIP
jgi:hypothetical protein